MRYNRSYKFNKLEIIMSISASTRNDPYGIFGPPTHSVGDKMPATVAVPASSPAASSAQALADNILGKKPVALQEQAAKLSQSIESNNQSSLLSFYCYTPPVLPKLPMAASAAAPAPATASAAPRSDLSLLLRLHSNPDAPLSDPVAVIQQRRQQQPRQLPRRTQPEIVPCPIHKLDF